MNKKFKKSVAIVMLIAMLGYLVTAVVSVFSR
jgi:hypothetical protein